MPDIDRNATLECLRKLVTINSVNPALEPGGAGEAEIAAYVASRLEGLGLEVRRHEHAAGRVSVVGRLRGTGGGRCLMLNGHVDTVGVAGMEAPFSAVLRDGRVHGRGAYDMKGSIAACLGAVEALVDSGEPLAGDVLVAAVADEEVASMGTAGILEHYRPDGAVVTEPTALRVCVAHKGFEWIEVVTRGVAAHGSRYELGVDANLRMGRVLHRLEALERELRARPQHPLLGTASLHAATLEGGTGPSTYAERCALQVERRTLPGEPDDVGRREIEAILDALRAEDPSLRVELRSLLARRAFEVGRDAAIVEAVRRAASDVLGAEPEVIGDSPWMDSALLADAGVETVVIGPAGAGAHALEEWVDVESVFDLARILVATARAYCGAGAPGR